MKVYLHILFWVFAALFLTLFYGYRNDSYAITAWFVGGLLPITMLTTYVFNYWLIPKYLFQEKTFRFILYMIYALIISAYVEILILVLLFVFMADLQIDTANFDSIFLLAGMYIPVLTGVVIKLFRSWKAEIAQKAEIEREKEEILLRISPQEETILLRADRKNHNVKLSEILFVEGLKDYVKIHLNEGKPLLVKETMASMEKLLGPFNFERVHKSYIISKSKINSFTSSSVEIKGTHIPIGRSFKPDFGR